MKKSLCSMFLVFAALHLVACVEEPVSSLSICADLTSIEPEKELMGYINISINPTPPTRSELSSGGQYIDGNGAFFSGVMLFRPTDAGVYCTAEAHGVENLDKTVDEWLDAYVNEGSVAPNLKHDNWHVWSVESCSIVGGRINLKMKVDLSPGAVTQVVRLRDICQVEAIGE